MTLEKLEIRDNIPMTKVMQIVNFIRLQIEDGTLKRPSQLPSIAGFSKTKQVSKETVEKAYRKLKEQGYIVAVKGKGCYLLEN